MPSWYYEGVTFLVAIYLLSTLVLFLSWYQWRCLSALAKPAVPGSLRPCSKRSVLQLLTVTLQPCLPCWHRVSALCAGHSLHPELDLWDRNAACGSTTVAMQIRKRKDNSQFRIPYIVRIISDTGKSRRVCKNYLGYLGSHGRTLAVRRAYRRVFL